MSRPVSLTAGLLQFYPNKIYSTIRIGIFRKCLVVDSSRLPEGMNLIHANRPHFAGVAPVDPGGGREGGMTDLGNPYFASTQLLSQLTYSVNKDNKPFLIPFSMYIISPIYERDGSY